MNEQQIRWSEEELLEIVRAVPLSVLKDNSKMESWYKENGYNKVELAAILTVVPGFTSPVANVKGTLAPCP